MPAKRINTGNPQLACNASPHPTNAPPHPKQHRVRDKGIMAVCARC
jgi:hypothetical protein